MSGSFQTAKEKDIRLPSDIVPLSYNLQLVPFIIPDNFTISGAVSIELACLGDTTNITLHSKQKEINSLNEGLLLVSVLKHLSHVLYSKSG